MNQLLSNYKSLIALVLALLAVGVLFGFLPLASGVGALEGAVALGAFAFVLLVSDSIDTKFAKDIITALQTIDFADERLNAAADTAADVMTTIEKIAALKQGVIATPADTNITINTTTDPKG